MYRGVEEITCVGTVISVEEGQFGNKLLIKVKDKKYRGSKLVVYSNFKNENLGDLVKVIGQYKSPETTRNFGGRSQEKYFFSRGVNGIVEAKNIVVVKERAISWYSLALNNFRSQVKEEIKNNLSKDSASVCIAIFMGDKGLLTEELIRGFSKSSLAHILAVSGMHLSYIIAIGELALKKVGSRRRKLVLITLTIIFCNFVGNLEAVVRATLMANMVIVGKLFHLKADSLTNLSVAAVLILFHNPFAIYSSSFILSFIGTLGIIIFYPFFEEQLKKVVVPKNKIFEYIIKSLLLAVSANLSLIPILAIMFNTFSLVFVFSCVFANVLITIIMPLILIFVLVSMCIPFLSKFIGNFLNLFLYILIMLVKFIEKLDFLSFRVCTPSYITIVYYYSCILHLYFYIKSNFKKILKNLLKTVSIIYIVISLIFYAINVCDRNLYIYFVDVGQGDCTLIVTDSKKKVLIDGGGNESGNYVGEQILIPYLLDRHIKCIDYIIVSHFDTDHVGGLIDVLECLNVKNVVISVQPVQSENLLKLTKIIKNKKINLITVKKGDVIKIDNNLLFNVLWPDKQNIIGENTLNNNSIVCKLQYKNFSMLFTGDIETIAEQHISAIYSKSELESNVLKVGHHGSITSTTEDFLNKVSPSIALIGVGKDNKFGHPSNVILKRLNESGVSIYRTDEMGEISIVVQNNGKINIKKQIK